MGAELRYTAANPFRMDHAHSETLELKAESQTHVIPTYSVDFSARGHHSWTSTSTYLPWLFHQAHTSRLAQMLFLIPSIYPPSSNRLAMIALFLFIYFFGRWDSWLSSPPPKKKKNVTPQIKTYSIFMN